MSKFNSCVKTIQNKNSTIFSCQGYLKIKEKTLIPLENFFPKFTFLQIYVIKDRSTLEK